MKRFLFFIFFFSSVITGSKAQVQADTVQSQAKDTVIKIDTVVVQDSIRVESLMDSVSKRIVVDTTWNLRSHSFTNPSFGWQVLIRIEYFDFKSKPIAKEGASIKFFKGKDFIFYLLVFLLLVFAIFRQLFPKYFSDLFRVFFRTTIKQTQIREQLMQTPLPSLMLNIFFVISTGLYITFILKHYNVSPVDNFWLLFFYCSLGLSIAYMVKFLGLKIAGWVFDIQQASDAYIFIVFITNKMIGILLLPLLVLLAFSEGDVYAVSITISWCLLAGLYLYRILLTYSVIRNQVKVNPFHFFLYFCAFELAPLLLVYRGLLVYFNVST